MDWLLFTGRSYEAQRIIQIFNMVTNSSNKTKYKRYQEKLDTKLWCNTHYSIAAGRSTSGVEAK